MRKESKKKIIIGFIISLIVFSVLFFLSQNGLATQDDEDTEATLHCSLETNSLELVGSTLMTLGTYSFWEEPELDIGAFSHDTTRVEISEIQNALFETTSTNFNNTIIPSNLMFNHTTNSIPEYTTSAPFDTIISTNINYNYTNFVNYDTYEGFTLETGNIVPNGDIQKQWQRPIGNDNYALIDEGIIPITIGGDYIFHSSDNEYTDIYTMGTIDMSGYDSYVGGGVGKQVYQITCYIYCYSVWSSSNIYFSGNQLGMVETPVSCPISNYGWRTVVWSGLKLNQTELNNLQITNRKPYAYDIDYYIGTMYCKVDFYGNANNSLSEPFKGLQVNNFKYQILGTNYTAPSFNISYNPLYGNYLPLKEENVFVSYYFTSMSLTYYDHINDLIILPQNLSLTFYFWFSEVSYNFSVNVSWSFNEWKVPTEVDLAINGEEVIDSTYNSGFCLLSTYPTFLMITATDTVFFKLNISIDFSFSFSLDVISKTYLRKSFELESNHEINIEQINFDSNLVIKKIYLNNADKGSSNPCMLSPSVSMDTGNIYYLEVILTEEIYLPLQYFYNALGDGTSSIYMSGSINTLHYYNIGGNSLYSLVIPSGWVVENGYLTFSNLDYLPDYTPNYSEDLNDYGYSSPSYGDEDVSWDSQYYQTNANGTKIDESGGSGYEIVYAEYFNALNGYMYHTYGDLDGYNSTYSVVDYLYMQNLFPTEFSYEDWSDWVHYYNPYYILSSFDSGSLSSSLSPEPDESVPLNDSFTFINGTKIDDGNFYEIDEDYAYFLYDIFNETENFEFLTASYDIGGLGGNDHPYDICYSNNYFYVTDGTFDYIYKYPTDFSTLTESYDIGGLGGNDYPRGICEYNNSFYVTDGTFDYIYQYPLDFSTLTTSYNIGALGGNNEPIGICYSNNYFYVVDYIDCYVYQYPLDFSTLTASYNIGALGGNDAPYGICEYNTYFYVVVYFDCYVYQYPCYSEHILNFTTEFTFTTNENGTISFINLFYSHKTNESIEISFYIWNYALSQWDLINSSTNNVGFFNNYFTLNSSYYDVSNTVKLKWYGNDTNHPFELYLDKLMVYVYYSMPHHYPATYSFTEELGKSGLDIGFVDSATLPNSCSVKIDAELDNHRNILNLTHDGGADDPIIVHNIDTPQTTGTWEWYWASSDISRIQLLRFYSSATIGIVLRISSGKYYYANLAGTSIEIVGDTPVNNIFDHFKLVFDCTTDRFDLYINNVLRVDDGEFRNVVDSINNINIINSDNAVYSQYLDAVGDVADPNYQTGDNYFYENYMGTHTFENYNITSNLTTLDGWTLTPATGCSININGTYDAHKKYMELFDNSIDQISIKDDWIPQTSGTTEFYFKSSDVVKTTSFLFYNELSQQTIPLQAKNNTIQYYITSWVNMPGGSINNNTWYNIKIVFNCATDTYDFYLNSVLCATNSFRFVSTTITYLSLRTSTTELGYYSYFDSLSFSWEDDINSSLILYMEELDDVYANINKSIDLPFLNRYDIGYDDYQKLYNVTIEFEYKWTVYNGSYLQDAQFIADSNVYSLILDGNWHSAEYTFHFNSGSVDEFNAIFNITNGELEIRNMNYTIQFDAVDTLGYNRLYQFFRYLPSLSLDYLQQTRGNWILNFSYTFIESSDAEYYNFYNTIDNSLLYFMIYINTENGWEDPVIYNYNTTQNNVAFSFNITQYINGEGSFEFNDFYLEFYLAGNPSEFELDDLILFDFDDEFYEVLALWITDTLVIPSQNLTIYWIASDRYISNVEIVQEHESVSGTWLLGNITLLNNILQSFMFENNTVGFYQMNLTFYDDYDNWELWTLNFTIISSISISTNYKNPLFINEIGTISAYIYADYPIHRVWYEDSINYVLEYDNSSYPIYEYEFNFTYSSAIETQYNISIMVLGEYGDYFCCNITFLSVIERTTMMDFNNIYSSYYQDESLYILVLLKDLYNNPLGSKSVYYSILDPSDITIASVLTSTNGSGIVLIQLDFDITYEIGFYHLYANYTGDTSYTGVWKIQSFQLRPIFRSVNSSDISLQVNGYNVIDNYIQINNTNNFTLTNDNTATFDMSILCKLNYTETIPYSEYLDYDYLFTATSDITQIIFDTANISSYPSNFTYYYFDNLVSSNYAIVGTTFSVLDIIGDTFYNNDDFNVQFRYYYDSIERTQITSNPRTDSNHVIFDENLLASRSFDYWYVLNSYDINTMSLNHVRTGTTITYEDFTIEASKYYFEKSSLSNDIYTATVDYMWNPIVNSTITFDNGTTCNVRITYQASLNINNVTIVLDLSSKNLYAENWTYSATQSEITKVLEVPHINFTTSSQIITITGISDTPYAIISSYTNLEEVSFDEDNYGKLREPYIGYLSYSKFSRSFLIYDIKSDWVLDGIHYGTTVNDILDNGYFECTGWGTGISSSYLVFTANPVDRIKREQFEDKVVYKITCNLPVYDADFDFYISGEGRITINKQLTDIDEDKDQTIMKEYSYKSKTYFEFENIDFSIGKNELIIYYEEHTIVNDIGYYIVVGVAIAGLIVIWKRKELLDKFGLDKNKSWFLRILMWNKKNAPKEKTKEGIEKAKIPNSERGKKKRVKIKEKQKEKTFSNKVLKFAWGESKT